MRPRLPYWTRAALTLAVLGGATAARPLDYDREVRPILSENCFPCHGQDSQEADGRPAPRHLRGRDGGPRRTRGAHAGQARDERCCTSGSPPSSPARRMPPAYSNRRLTPEQIATLKRWIGEGGNILEALVVYPARCGRRCRLSRIAHGSSSRSTPSSCSACEQEGLQARPAPPIRRRGCAAFRWSLTGTPAGALRLDAFAGGARSRAKRRMPPRSTGCWPRRGTASAWRWTGSTSRTTPTRTASTTIPSGPCGDGATG